MTLLDTSVIVHYLKGDPEIAARLNATPCSELAIPSVVVYELEYGTLRAKISPARRRQIAEGFKSIQHVPFDSEAALAAARVRVALEMRGITMGPLDLLIAGTALSRGATLVTNNIEFSRVPGLRVEDWRNQ
jgi:tRNA(fMet)-specific endonuclease VapC